MVHCFQYRKRVRKYNKLVLASQVLMKSKARSIALASAVKIDESSGICYILLWESDIKGPEYDKNINTLLMDVEKFHQLHTETTTAVATSS